MTDSLFRNDDSSTQIPHSLISVGINGCDNIYLFLFKTLIIQASLKMENFYPPSPIVDKALITKTEASYQRNIVFTLIGILLFIGVYVYLLAGAAWFIYLSITYPLATINQFTILIKLGAVAMAVTFFIFLVKFLFKKQSRHNPLHIEITEKEHPKLFAFIRKLSKETGVAFPKKVYVNHEINAFVFYHNPILSLFFPARKNLLIGLGLVNAINLSEFKAVLAHEFGHFSQGSMRLGSYVYMANRIIHSMVYDRDKWDETLENWSRSDFRIAIFAWALLPFVWLTRQLMILLYRGINLLQSSLSRQMEFHADSVAVSVTGSNAIINGLYKLGSSSEAYHFALSHVNSALDHKIYTDNIFYHHTEAYDYLKNKYPEFAERLLENKKPIKNGQYIFSEDDEQIPDMYASHPPNYKREANAKKQFIEGIEDERSPWLLFENGEALAQKVTKNLLQHNLELGQDVTFAPAVEVQIFIENEIEELTYDEQYKGVYDDRFISNIEFTNVEDLYHKYQLTETNLGAFTTALYDARLENKMKELMQHRTDAHLLSLVLNDQLGKQKVEVRGQAFGRKEKKDAEKLYNVILEEFEEDDKWYEEFDQKVYLAYYLMYQLLKKDAEPLRSRYQFHLNFQDQFSKMQQINNRLQELVNEVMLIGELSEQQVYDFAANFVQLRDFAEEVLKDLDHLQLPPLNNMENIQSLADFLLEKPLVRLPKSTLDGQYIQILLHQLDEIVAKCRRLYFKSLGGMLSLQEGIYKAYKEQISIN